MVSATVVAAALGVALVDQQLNGANPRLYDFKGALAEIAERAEPGDVVLYEPGYLAEVVDYYAAGIEARPVGSKLLDGDRKVFVLATERVINAEDTSARLGHELAVLDRQLDIVDVFERPNVRVWELSMTSASSTDCRLERADVGRRATPAVRTASGPRCSPLGSTVALVLYFSWLLRPDRVGNPVLFAVLVAAELFNVVQALGFWWTCLAGRRRRAGRVAATGRRPSTSTCSSRPTASRSRSSRRPSAAAARLRGARVHVALLDDGNREEMAELARRHGVRYVRRTLHHGAKAGNINHALGRTGAPFVLVLDCDHVPHPDLLERHAARVRRRRASPTCRRRSTTPTPARTGSPRAAWSQQALFFGPIARGKDAHAVDVLLRHQRRVPPPARSRRSAGSRRAR